MKRTLKQSQLENMISECVGQVLAESRQPRRQSMNEAQLSRYIQNIINEEMEDEGFGRGLSAMTNKIFGDAKNSVNQAGRDIKASVLKKGKQMRDFGNNVKNKVGNTVNQIAQYGKDVYQAGKNASAAADAEKIANEIDALYQKYKPFFNDAKKAGQMRTAKSALLWLSKSFGNGLDAYE